MADYQSALLVTQGVDRIEVGGFKGGEKAEDHADHGTYGKSNYNGLTGDEGRKSGELGEQGSKPVTRTNPKCAPDDTQKYRLYEKLPQHIPGTSPHGQADADFAGALGDTDEHDVHDTDAADNEGNTRKGTDQDRHDPVVRVKKLAHLRLAPDGKILLFIGCNLVGLAQYGNDLIGDVTHHVRSGSSGAEGSELGIAGQAFHNAGVRHDDDVVLILAEGIGAL